MAASKWLLFLDADNRVPPTFVSQINNQISKKNIDIATAHINADTNNTKDIAIAKLLNMAMDIRKITPTPHGFEACIVCSKSVFNKLGGFDTQIKFDEGADLYKRAKKQGYDFEVLKRPTYTYSFRRMRKEGTLKIARSVAQMKLRRLIMGDVDPDQAEKLYPMHGGAYYDSANTSGPEHMIHLLEKTINISPTNLRKRLKEIFEELTK